MPMTSNVQAEGSAAALAFAAAVIVTVALLFSMLGRPRHCLKGRHVIITGGSEGIGLSLAHEVALRGATVSLLSRTQGKLDVAAEQLRAAVKECAVHTFAANVTDYAQARGVSARIVSQSYYFCALCVADTGGYALAGVQGNWSSAAQRRPGRPAGMLRRNLSPW